MSERVSRRRVKKDVTGRQSERRMSEYERRSQTEEGRLSLAAASLATQVASLLERAKERSGVNGQKLAERLGLSEGRVSQVLNGDGNVRIATLARFLYACGYELDLVARPVRKGLPELDSTSARRPRESRVDVTYHVFEQVYVTSAGVTSHLNSVPSGLDRPVPMGGPVCVSDGEPSDAERTSASISIWNWQSLAAGAVLSEGAARPVKVAKQGSS